MPIDLGTRDEGRTGGTQPGAEVGVVVNRDMDRDRVRTKRTPARKHAIRGQEIPAPAHGRSLRRLGQCRAGPPDDVGERMDVLHGLEARRAQAVEPRLTDGADELYEAP